MHLFRYQAITKNGSSPQPWSYLPLGRSRSIIRKHSEEKHIGILLLSISTIFIICQSFKVSEPVGT